MGDCKFVASRVPEALVSALASNTDPLLKGKGGLGSSVHPQLYGLAVAMNSAYLACSASVNLGGVLRRSVKV